MKINLIEAFEETVDRFPTKTAVIEGKTETSFSALNGMAYTFAEEITKKSDGDFSSPKPIAVFMNKCAMSIAADLGVLISGNFYMNLDIKTPAERISNILTLVKPAAIITNSKYLKLIEAILPDRLIVIDADNIPFTETINEDKFRSIRSNRIDTDPSCIINTSGSTGTPKGVVLNHRSFFDFIEWSIDTFHFGEDMVMGSLSPMVFDIYSYELCMLMTKGATLVIIPDNLSAFPAKILEIVEANQVNFLFWVPTIMVNIANMDLLSTFHLKSLKTVWFAGEVFPTKQFNYWYHKLPHAIFANLYGPIEITLDCTYYIIQRNIPDEEPIPIGHPCRNTSILILDEDNQLVTESGLEGEPCVRGSSLAMGYYNNPEKTTLAFTQNPLNKTYPETIYRTGDVVEYNNNMEIVFKGRRDNLIKHMGYRTDLGEIEHVIINKMKLVKNGCVTYNFKAKEITLHYEAEREIVPAEFRKLISKELPKYMIPSVYVREEELKRNTNGKIDRLYYKTIVNG